MAGWHHWLDGRETEWTPRDGDGQGGVLCCDSWGHKESDTTERLNWTEMMCVRAEKAMAPHSSTLALKIPWMEGPGRLQSMGSRRVGHDWATSLSLFTFMHWRRKWRPTPVFLLENPRDGGAWWAAVYGVAQSRTRLKQLSSSSSMCVRERKNSPTSKHRHKF